jgi:hypothetical protein
MNESRLDEDLKALSKDVVSRLGHWTKPLHLSRAADSAADVLRYTGELAGGVTFHFRDAVVGSNWCRLWTSGRLECGPNQDRSASPTENRLAVSVTREVIDMACYIDDGASGPDHALSELALQPSTSGRSC